MFKLSYTITASIAQKKKSTFLNFSLFCCCCCSSSSSKCVLSPYICQKPWIPKKIYIKVDGWSVSFGYISLTLLRLRIQITAHLWVERQIVVNTHFKKVRWSSALSFSWTLFGRYDDLQFWVAIEHFSEEICYKFIQSSFQRAPNNC